MKEPTYFDKYDRNGAYHWVECDRRLSNWQRYNPALDARYELVVQAVRLLASPKAELLDVGCGDGMLLGRLARCVERATGVDSEATAIQIATEKLEGIKNCRAIHTTCYDLPFEKANFEFVTSADVIEHLKDPKHHLEEIVRVLKPGGIFILTTPKWRCDRKWDIRHEKEYRPEELQSLLSAYFPNVELSYFWPAKYSRLYETRLGWRTLKLFALFFYNPFLGRGSKPDGFGQMLAICRSPRASSLKQA